MAPRGATATGKPQVPSWLREGFSVEETRKFISEYNRKTMLSCQWGILIWDFCSVKARACPNFNSWSTRRGGGEIFWRFFAQLSVLCQAVGFAQHSHAMPCAIHTPLSLSLFLSFSLFPFSRLSFLSRKTRVRKLRENVWRGREGGGERKRERNLGCKSTKVECRRILLSLRKAIWWSTFVCVSVRAWLCQRGRERKRMCERD